MSQRTRPFAVALAALIGASVLACTDITAPQADCGGIQNSGTTCLSAGIQNSGT